MNVNANVITGIAWNISQEKFTTRISDGCGRFPSNIALKEAAVTNNTTNVIHINESIEVNFKLSIFWSDDIGNIINIKKIKVTNPLPVKKLSPNNCVTIGTAISPIIIINPTIAPKTFPTKLSVTIIAALEPILSLTILSYESEQSGLLFKEANPIHSKVYEQIIIWIAVKKRPRSKPVW